MVTNKRPARIRRFPILLQRTKRWCLCIVALAPALVYNSAWAGEVTTASVWGAAVYVGEVPERRPVEMRGDPYCVKITGAQRPLRDDVVVTSGGRLANVVVYVKDGIGAASKPTSPSSKVQFTLRNCAFVPHVAAVQVGQKVGFVNRDGTVHTIHARTRKNPRFNFALLASLDSPLRTAQFPNPELAVELRCDVHPWEQAYVAVFDHPYFAVTSSDGTFILPDLPAGDFTLEAWHERWGTVAQRVKLNPGQRLSVQFVFGKPGEVTK